ncbi:VIT1/CCC1 transporter family protein [Beutenbergia cavernae]|nr:VIT1/CCC1 transporter family protein [Beutenbergia cavernae]
MAADDGVESPTRRWWLRARLIEANDGIIAAAGVVEGIAGAGGGDETLLVAGLAIALAGGAAAGGAAYAEAAVEEDAEDALVEDERRRLAEAPDEELAELTAIYERKGLSPRLAREVATELTAHDALAAQLEAEHGLDLAEEEVPAWRSGFAGALAFGLGALIPLAVMELAPPSARVPMTFVVVVVALTITATIAARTADSSVPRAVARTVAIGAGTMLATWAVGTLIGS